MVASSHLRSLSIVVAGALALVACAPHANAPAAQPAGPDAEATRAHVERKLEQARAALHAGAWREAHEAADEARNVSTTSDLERVRALIGEIDRAEADDVAAKVGALANDRKCTEAVDAVAAFVRRVPPPPSASLSTVRAAAGEPLVACLRDDIERAVRDGDFAGARATIDSPGATVALEESAWKQLSAKLHAAIASVLAARIDEDVAAEQVEQAVAKLHEAVTSGEVDETDEQGALEKLRQTVAALQQRKVDAAIGAAKPDEALAELDGLVKLLAWQLPEPLATSRDALAAWAECKRLGAVIPPKPEPRFLYGKTEVLPSDASDADAIDRLASASKVTVVARARALSLVVTGEAPPPGAPLKERLLAAAGWVQNERLEKSDTIDWLLPGDELVGQRVFGPFSDKDKLHHLGVVVAVSGGDATVERYSDGQRVTLPRARLRSGRVPPGTRVLTTCANMLDVAPAIVEREIPQEKGQALFHIVCTGGSETAHDEVPGGLVTKPEYLPPRRP